MVSVPRNKLAFPQQMKTQLRYCTKIAFDVAASTTSYHFPLRANGMYDPEVNLGGHQPRGFDEFMSTYNTFTVTGSSCSVNFMYVAYEGPSVEGSPTIGLIKSLRSATTDESPGLAPVVCGIHKGLETLTAGPAEEQMEKDRTQWTVMTHNSGPVTLKSSLKVTDFYGKGALVGAEGYTGSATADPSEIILYDVWIARGSANSSGKVHCTGYATVTYDVVFTEPKTLGKS